MIIAQTSCGASAPAVPEPITQEEFLLDTICTLSIYRMTDDAGNVKDAVKCEEEAKAASDAAFALCRELEDKLSRTRTDSDVSRINKADGKWTEVSGESLELIKKGLEYSELSGGAFDITVGGITKLWDFHAAEGEATVPDEKALEEAAKHVSYRNLEIDADRVRLKDPEAEMDLGGIAKGYIGDKMTELLEEKGVTSGIINLGGNVICIGGKTDSEDFIIGIEAPFSDRKEIIGKVDVRNKSVVTSGVYERKFEKDGIIYHHILDTRTGWPVATDLEAVTLLANKGRSADIDALSTICLIKGSKEGLSLIEETDGVEAVFVLSDGSIKKSEGMEFEEE